jgi:divalent metal cation (Fe/Co/Zn/Cd) transporter
MPVLDGVASVVIGVLLAGVAVLLIAQSRGLLIGEGIRPETARAIRALAMEQPNVEDVGHVLSMYIGPDEVLAIVDVNFRDDTSTGDAADAIAAIEKQVRARFPMIKRIFIEASDAPSGDMGAERKSGVF